MTECESVQPLSTRWVDGELGPDDRARVDAHLNTCPVCRALLAAERTARTILRERGSALCRAEAAPAGLRERCRAASAVSARRAPRRRLLTAVAATIVLVTGGWTLHVMTERSTTVLAAQLAADHVKCHLLAGDEDLQADVVQRRLLSEYGFHARVPPGSADARLRLIGARRCLTGEGTNAHMLYEFDGRPVSLYLVPQDSRRETDVELLGQRAYVWSRHNGTYVLIADREAADLPRLAAYVRHATEQE